MVRLFFVIIFCITYLPAITFGQCSIDSSSINKLNDFQLIDTSSLRQYKTLISSSLEDLSIDQKIEFLQKGFDFSKATQNLEGIIFLVTIFVVSLCLI